ncbi:flagellar hook-basal body complex protein FliE [Candidatus Acidulodesulfobacterium sp. H_13]|uniref:flagellar hook-basal body complex protein FliE n=1 Tax=Candidatus Acidulodesulfobacterium sp. H_13 TaxID=3395470 RepID=UPI003AF71393
MSVVINPDSIKNLNPNNILKSGENITGAQKGNGSFGDTLLNSINKVNDLQISADNSAEDIAIGKSSNIHQAMINIEKANDSFELMMQVRNKIITAYNQIMNMQV